MKPMTPLKYISTLPRNVIVMIQMSKVFGLNSVQKKKCIFCPEISRMDLDTWQSVLWLDEETFAMTGRSGRKVKNSLRCPPPAIYQKNGNTPCFPHGMELLHLSYEKMNQNNYLDLPSSFEITIREARASFPLILSLGG